MAKTIFLVANSGTQGYMYEPMFCINESMAFDRVSYWESIGDTASVSIYHVPDKLYKALDSEYNGKCYESDMYELESKYDVNYQV